jgi:cytochrome P450
VLRSIFGTDLARLEQQARRQSLRSGRQGDESRPEVRVSLPLADQTGGELIERRRREPEEHFDFLSMLMATRDRDTDAPMSDKEMIDEVLTLIVAGHETTAAALTWTWYLVSQHPEVAERLQAEADAVSPRAPWPGCRRVA